MARAARAIEGVDRASIKKTGLSVTDFSILEALLHKGPLPVNTIGKKVLLTSGSMTAAVNRLERKGLVRRVQDVSDGRYFHVHLTGAGRDISEAAYEQHARNLEKMASVMTTQERDELVRLLKKIGEHAARMETD
jgi:MarR family 2-MHQ and catechol resistance regulon transcriptional repressor